MKIKIFKGDSTNHIGDFDKVGQNVEDGLRLPFGNVNSYCGDNYKTLPSADRTNAKNLKI